MIHHPENWTAKSRAERDEAIVERLLDAKEVDLALALARARYTRRVWVADDGNGGPIVYDDADSAEDAAQEYVDDGDWGDDSAGCYTIYTWPGYYVGEAYVEDREDRDSHNIVVDPDEPDCDDGHEHDWCTPHAVLGGIKSNPGCWAHGGGVIAKEICRHCGLLKTTDTYATNPSNGTPYTQVSYTAMGDHEHSYDFESWAREEETQ